MKFREIKAIHRIGALALAAPILMAPGLDQTAAPGAASAAQGLGSNLANMAGLSEIAKGSMNQQQGQQMQNMAQMAMGAMQIASGLLGLLAAAGMGDKSGQNANNAADMGGLGSNPFSPSSTAPTPDGTNPSTSSVTTTTSSTGGDAKGSSIKIDPAILRTGTVGAALDGIEKNFGIPRDQFVDALKNGVDPKDILANAPKNAPSREMLDKIADGLANSSGRSLASSGSSSSPVNPGGASAAGTPAGDTAETTAGGPKPPASTAPPEDLDPANMANVSPEVRAALAAKAEAAKSEADMRDMATWNLFQLVHNRYKKLEVMLYGRVERTNPNPTKGF
jgi:hypothetical protein